MKKYGMPYKGSKTLLADRIVEILPAGDVLVDAFGGGGAITDCAARSGKWKHVIYNELEPVVYNGFRMAINGEFASENRWISREDFLRLKDSDPYAAICFSFGCNLKTYAYAPEIERFKRHLHYMAFAKTPTEALKHWRAFVNEFELVRLDIERITQDGIRLCEETNVEPIYRPDGTLDAAAVKAAVFRGKSANIRKYLRDALESSGKTQAEVDKYLGNQMSGHYFGSSQWMLPTAEQYEKLQKILPALTVPWSKLNEQLEKLKILQSLESLESLQSLQSLERLQSLQRLQSLESLQRYKITLYNKSYREIPIPENAVIYCDPPYKDTNAYISEFDHYEFYDWVRNNPAPVFVSEYRMPEGFHVVAEWDARSSLGTGNNKRTREKLYCNDAGFKRLEREHEQLMLWAGEKHDTVSGSGTGIS